MSLITQNKKKRKRCDYRITRGYLRWLFGLFWRDVHGPVFDCLMKWVEDDILLLQTIRSLGVKYRDRVECLYPYGFRARNCHPDYHYQAYVDLNDQTACLVGAPVFLEGLAKIKIIYRLCSNGCYALGIMISENTQTRELVIVEIMRHLSAPPGLSILSPYYNDIMHQKSLAYHQTIEEKFPMIQNVGMREGLKLYPQGTSFHYSTEKGICVHE